MVMGGRTGAMLGRLLGYLAAIVLFLMMALTFIAVLGRYLFNTPIPGAFEITEMMMATLIFAGLPIVTANQEHIVIDLFDAFVPRRLRAPRDGFISLASGTMMGFLTWRMSIKAYDTVSFNDITAVLNIPMWPMTYFMFAMSAATTVVLLMLSATQFFPRFFSRA